LKSPAPEQKAFHHGKIELSGRKARLASAFSQNIPLKGVRMSQTALAAKKPEKVFKKW
jgi:hypothetical protein